MLRYIFKLVLLHSLVVLTSVEAALSVPLSSDVNSQRAMEIAAVASQIKNEPRTFLVGDNVFSMYSGPLAAPGTLALQLRLAEVAKLQRVSNDLPQYAAATTAALLPRVKSLDDVVRLYDYVAPRLERPSSLDIDDDSFGYQRLTVKSMKLRLVANGEFSDTAFQLSDAQLPTYCGKDVTAQNIRQRKQLFVEDFGDVSQWNDPEKPEKYVPDVVGFFCYNKETKKLVPIEIRVLSTNLTYSPLDSENEWKLAKMALNAASVCYHQWQHMADTHATLVPIRVELLRNLAAVHPVRVLLEYHAPVDFGLEMLVSKVLLSPNTAMDRTFGWGATGSTRFLMHQTNFTISLNNNLPTDLADRGLIHIPVHKYGLYGRKLYAAIHTFVGSYVRAYYPTNAAVASDFELQNWARATSQVPHLHDFPSSIPTRARLSRLLAHVVFLCAVRHHAMNSATTWHMAPAPYSAPALWKPMPMQKLQAGENINLMEYAIPVPRIPELLALTALFHREPLANESLASAYQTAPFSTEPQLQSAIATFKQTLESLDAFIQQNEAKSTRSYEILRPSKLPANSWI